VLFGCHIGITNIQNILDFKKNHGMKFGLQNYAIIMLNEESCIKFNKKLNTIVYKGMALYRVVQLLSQPNLKISHHHHI
jgi:hypothetical protein